MKSLRKPQTGEKITITKTEHETIMILEDLILRGCNIMESLYWTPSNEIYETALETVINYSDDALEKFYERISRDHGINYKRAHGCFENGEFVCFRVVLADTAEQACLQYKNTGE